MGEDTVVRVREAAAAALGAAVLASRPYFQAADERKANHHAQRPFTPLSLSLANTIRHIHLVRMQGSLCFVLLS